MAADIEHYRERFDDPPDREPDRELVLTLEGAGPAGAGGRPMIYDWIYFNPVEWTGAPCRC